MQPHTDRHRHTETHTDTQTHRHTDTHTNARKQTWCCIAISSTTIDLTKHGHHISHGRLCIDGWGRGLPRIGKQKQKQLLMTGAQAQKVTRHARCSLLTTSQQQALEGGGGEGGLTTKANKHTNNPLHFFSLSLSISLHLSPPLLHRHTWSCVACSS